MRGDNMKKKPRRTKSTKKYVDSQTGKEVKKEDITTLRFKKGSNFK